EAPRTFSIPRSDQRTSLRPGDVVKLVFEADQPSERGFTAERMWVEVREVRPDGYVGVLNNRPSFLADLQPGARVAFGPQHVAALEVSPSGLDLPFGFFARVSPELARGEGWPMAAVRHPSGDPSSSGWEIGAGDDPGGERVPMMVDDLLQQYRVLDSILDEPAGTSWRWDDGAMEYVRAEAPASSHDQPGTP
ncbi:MAG: hypothetical protein ACJ8J0_18020, partial [Longimicrobiaceae bacterium]